MISIQAINLFRIRRHAEAMEVIQDLLYKDIKYLSGHYALINFLLQLREIKEVSEI